MPIADRDTRALSLSLVVLALPLAGLVAMAGAQYLKRSQTEQSVASAMTGGDALKAPFLMRRYGCAGCHEISGVPGADGKVGPSLDGLRERVYIGGVAANRADNLIRWIVNPQAFSPGTAMPASGISEAEARDVAAYLYGH